MAFYFVISVAIWLAATAVIRVGGQILFAPGQSLALALAFAFLPPVMALLTRQLLTRVYSDVDKLTATIILALPSMSLDVASIVAFSRVFPNLDLSMRGIYAAWLLWGYASMLITGLLLARPVRDIVVPA